MVYFGVDGCRMGWFFVKAETKTLDLDFGVVETIEELINDASADSTVLIDIPIGLRDKSGNPRTCDTMARQLLGPKRASSVFPAPIRAILDEISHTKTTKKSTELSGKDLSVQVFSIIPKIREIDDVSYS